MKRLILFLLLALTLASATAQKKPAKKEQTPQKEQVPSQKELDEMMKEMQSSLDEMSPEDKKMMDSLGIKMPNAQNMKKMAEFAMANSELSPEKIVPVKDVSRISAIPKTSISKSTAGAYVQSLHQKIKEGLPKEIVTGTNELYNELKSKYQNLNAIANAAVGCWSFGKPAPALLLMSRVCMEDPTNSDHLNNFAAMVSMSGGEHLSLPILQYLNRQHPKNSTILNNIAHAWFGLGDLQKASLYIDSTIRLCAWHPQANQIKAAIEESKGNKTAAVEAMKKAISRMHSNDKERKLNDLGYDLQAKDIIWNPKRKSDGLGLSKFTWPEFPKNVDASDRVKKNWEDFVKDCNRRLKKLEEDGAIFEEANQKFQAERIKLAASYKPGDDYSGLLTPISPKAIKKLQPKVEELILLEGTEPFYEMVDKLRSQVAGYQEIQGKELRDLQENFKGKMGEGYGIPLEYCEALDGIHNQFLNDANSAVEVFCKKMSSRLYTRINEMAHFNLYRFTEVEQNFHNNLLQREWIGAMKMAADLVHFQEPTTLCSKKVERKKNPLKPLPDFDEVNCANKSTMNLIYGSIRSECGRTYAEIEIDFVKLGWETKSADLEKNRNFLDEFQRCTIEISTGTGKSFGEGPLQLQTSVGATGFIEIDRSGIADAGVKVAADVSIGSNVVDTKVETDIGEVQVGPGDPSSSIGGINATISINSGFTATGSGILKGVKF